MLPRLSDVELSIVLRPMFAIGSVLTSGNVPLLHTSAMSFHVISFARPSLVLVLRATNAGVRRPGYKATGVTLDLLGGRVEFAVCELRGCHSNMHHGYNCDHTS